MKLSSSDASEVEKLASSPSFLKLADSILQNMDRNTLAEFLAGYFYFKSRGKKNRDFVFFLTTNKFPKLAMIAVNVLAVLLPGLLFDKAFRLVVFGSGTKPSRKSTN